MQVPQWADPIPMGRRGGLGPRAMSRGWGHGTDYFLVPGIPVLNWQVVVELHVRIYVVNGLQSLRSYISLLYKSPYS